MKNKRLFSLFLVAIIVLGNVLPVFASEEPLYLDSETGKEYFNVDNLIDDILSGKAKIENIYERKGTEGYVNINGKYEAKKEAWINFIREKGIAEPEELLENEELLMEFVEAGNEAAEAVPTKTKEEVV